MACLPFACVFNTIFIDLFQLNNIIIVFKWSEHLSIRFERLVCNLHIQLLIFLDPYMILACINRLSL